MSDNTHISSTLEDYLEVILALSAKGDKARAGDIAEALSVHKSTVTAALKTLTAKGLVSYAPYESAALTAQGRKIAERVVHDHTVIKQFLTDILQIKDAVAEANACRMEHVMDRTVLDRLVLFAGQLRQWRDSDDERLHSCAVAIEQKMRRASRRGDKR